MRKFETTVGIADDFPAIRTFVRSGIKQLHGYSLVLEADNGAALFQQLEACEKLPEILLLDISMPGLDGYEVMKILKRQYKDIKVLVISLYREEFAVVQMMRLGASGFLEKGRLENLDAALQQLQEGKRYFSSGIAPEWTRKLVCQNRPVSFAPREKQTLRLCAAGLTLEQMAYIMNVSSRTVHEYKTRLAAKLNVHNTNEMVRVAMGAGLLTIGEPMPVWEDELKRKRKKR